MTTLRCTHQTTAFPEIDALAPPSSVGQVSNRQAELKTWATTGNAIAPVNRFADERREKRGLRKTLCLQLTMTTEINDEECCHISKELRNLDLGVGSVTRHSEGEI